MGGVFVYAMFVGGFAIQRVRIDVDQVISGMNHRRCDNDAFLTIAKKDYSSLFAH